MKEDPLFGANATCKTVGRDLKLFKQLGLKPFEAKLRKSHYVGKVSLSDGSWIRIWVDCWPAMFWRFQIFKKSTGEYLHVNTGSGALTNYWNTAVRMAEGTISILGIRTNDTLWSKDDANETEK